MCNDALSSPAASRQAEDPGEDADEDTYELARRALARAQDTARNRGFRTRPGRKQSIHNPRVTPGHGRDPAEVQTSVDRLVAMMGWRRELTVASVLRRWEDIVGPEIAAHCQPEQFDAGELRIRTDSTTWATQLRYLLPQIERRLALEVGENMVTAIHIRGPNSRQRRGRWTVQGRGERDTWG